ncbi:MAG: S-methyl-5-thioribose-1-phosphate isomerase [Synergistaceae bacterium]|nr:S-methyl-5-thioribose-1-phosphate isomerase [Synergistaceae bacterium]
MLPKTIEWLCEIPLMRLLDQRKIPTSIEFRDCRTYEETAAAIEDMTVRGAPAIGVAAAYGVVLAAHIDHSKIEDAFLRLSATRPTAVNLFWSIERMRLVYTEYKESPELYQMLESEALKIEREDREINRKIGESGQKILPEIATVITHCNAGALATAGYGTALGVLRAAKEAGKQIKVYADETRPRLQGGRLTAFELCEDGFDVTVICDSMAPFLMSREKIDAVITGADRIALNGDTANKIGTYGLAVSAKRHNVPFYIAAPISTIDFNCPTGEMIPIEERDHDEVRMAGSEIFVYKKAKVWNPAFDVTPAELITGIITEAGIFEPSHIKELQE